MEKKDLMTGDIIVTRFGELGVILKENDRILYQNNGADDLSDFSDDLRYEFEEDPDSDIMEVYRDCTFLEIDIGEASFPVFVRDDDWRRPSKKEREARMREMEKRNKELHAESAAELQEKRKNLIFIVDFNRTGQEVRPDDIDYFLRGICLSPYRDKLTPEDEATIRFHEDEEPVDRQVIRVPDSEEIVIVYDKAQEEKAVIEGRTRFITCNIPELNITLHTRCFACRMDENGTFRSLENGDGEKYVKYFR